MNPLLKLVGMPEPASAHAKGIDDLIVYVHLLMAVLFLGWMLYFFLRYVPFSQGC